MLTITEKKTKKQSRPSHILSPSSITGPVVSQCCISSTDIISNYKISKTQRYPKQLCKVLCSAYVHFELSFSTSPTEVIKITVCVLCMNNRCKSIEQYWVTATIIPNANIPFTTVTPRAHRSHYCVCRRCGKGWYSGQTLEHTRCRAAY